MPARKTPSAELAERLVQQLRNTERSANRSLTLRQLADSLQPGLSAKAILGAASPRQKAFSGHAVVARADLDAPVALLDRLHELAESAALLEFVLTASRSAGNVAFTPSVLRGKVTSKLQKPFQDALNRNIDTGALPPTVGWVLVNRSKKLFLMSDLHVGRGGSAAIEPDAPARGTAGAVTGPAAIEPDAPARGIAGALAGALGSAAAKGTTAAVGVDFPTTLDTAFRRLDVASGNHNFVNLVELRREVGLDRQSFDVGLNELRRQGLYSLSAAEGRHGITAEEQQAGILEGGTLLLYVSRRL